MLRLVRTRVLLFGSSEEESEVSPVCTGGGVFLRVSFRDWKSGSNGVSSRASENEPSSGMTVFIEPVKEGGRRGRPLAAGGESGMWTRPQPGDFGARSSGDITTGLPSAADDDPEEDDKER